MKKQSRHVVALNRSRVVVLGGILLAMIIGWATSRPESGHAASQSPAPAHVASPMPPPPPAPQSATTMPPDIAAQWTRALAQSDSAERTRGLLATLRGWARTNPLAAMQWASEQHDVAGPLAFEAVLKGAAAQPTVALALARALISADPSFAMEQGSALLRALGDEGHFALAIEFAHEMPPELITGLTLDVFQQWALQQPQAAIDALPSLADGSLRESAFAAVMIAWAGSDAPTAAGFLLTQSPGADRDKIFRQTISLWAERDPVALAQWLGGVPAGADFDTGAAALVALAENRYDHPDRALPWIDLISDPKRKREALEHVFRRWRESDPVAAQSYLAGVSWLSPMERTALYEPARRAP